MADVQLPLTINENQMNSVISGSPSIEDSLKVILRNARIHDGLSVGIKAVSKSILKKEAQLCVFCDSVTEKTIPKLIEGLINDAPKKIPLIKISDSKMLGEWAGLCKLDRDGVPRKVVGTSCVAITNWGEDSEERNVLLQNFST